MKWLKISLCVFAPALVLASMYVERVHVLGLISLYGAISIGRIIFQSAIARAVLSTKDRPARQPMASIILPVFNEPVKVFRPALKSLMLQRYRRFEVIVVDDGSDNARENKAICEHYGATYIYQENAGKREAMYTGFKAMSPETKVVLTADSDTVWTPEATRDLVRTLAIPGTGAATGYVAVTNARDNLLTRMIDLRYYMAFNQERAAQSFFGVVTCVSGPLGAYRRDLIEKVKDDFLTQTFFGKPCTFGDDRHLTNLILLEGYTVRYSKAVCYTQAPTNLFDYIKQQARWGKSHWREMIWQFKALPKHSLYLSYDWTLTLLLPFLLSASLGYYLVLLVTGHPHYILILAGMIFGMTFLKILEPMVRTRRIDFLLFVLYTVLHLTVLLPLKFYALLTVNVTKWGTRQNLKALRAS